MLVDAGALVEVGVLVEVLEVPLEAESEAVLALGVAVLSALWLLD